ncbi:hypothetical protein [Novosphingobium sp. THN1]|nr:hypothetical protein [Novosphingobium sp. THN1]
MKPLYAIRAEIKPSNRRNTGHELWRVELAASAVEGRKYED